MRTAAASASVDAPLLTTIRIASNSSAKRRAASTYSTQEDLLAAAKDAAAILIVSEIFDADIIKKLTACKVISRFGIGVDTIDLEAAASKGIVVCNVPDSNSNEVATHAMTMALALNRRLLTFDKAIRNGDWALPAVSSTIRRPQVLTFGLIGLGNIGSRVAAMAAAIGFHTCAYDPHVPDVVMRERGIRPVSLDEAIAQSDILSLHLPLTPTTRSILGADQIASMKKNSVLINVSRGGLVDEDALSDALERGHLAGAGLDVYAVEPLPRQSRLRVQDSVILSPHAAHSSADAISETIDRAFANAALVLRGRPPLHRVV